MANRSALPIRPAWIILYLRHAFAPAAKLWQIPRRALTRFRTIPHEGA